MIDIAIIILELSSSLGVICSLLTLFLIFRMEKLNVFLFIVVNLTVAQLFYNISIIIVPVPGFITEVFYVGLRSISGLSTTFWTNMISFVVLHTIIKRKIFDAANNWLLLFLLINIPSFTLGIFIAVALAYNVDSDYFFYSTQIYYWIRIISIVVNIISYFLLSSILFYRNRGLSLTERARNPLRNIVRRMKYYPLVQIVTRLAVAWYEYEYGHTYSFHQSDPLKQKIALFMYVVMLPSAGVGYFIVFAISTPNALIILRNDIILASSCCGRLFDPSLMYQTRRRSDENTHTNRLHLLHGSDSSGMGSTTTTSSSNVILSSDSSHDRGSLGGGIGGRFFSGVEDSDEATIDDIIRLQSQDNAPKLNGNMYGCSLDKGVSNIILDTYNP